MYRQLLKLCVGGVIFGAYPSIAQDISQCYPALTQSVVNEQTNANVRLSFWQTVNSTSFDEIKRGGGTGAIIPVQGVPISGFANYDDFYKAVKTEAKSLGFTFTEDRSRNSVFVSFAGIRFSVLQVS